MLVSSIGLAVISLIAALFLEHYRRDIALVFTAVCGIVIFIGAVSRFSDIFVVFKEMFSAAGVESDILEMTIKSTGICYVTSFAADLCRDFGHTSLASNIELTGRLSILVIVLPLISYILDTALELAG